MEWVETTGRTIEDAKEAALDELGVDAQDAEFEVLEEPRNGLFGRLRSEGRVRARVRPVAPRAKDERRRRGRTARPSGPREAAGPDGAGTTTDEPPVVGDEAKAPSRPRSRSGARGGGKGSGPNGAAKAGADDADAEAQPDEAAPGRPKRNPARGGQATPSAETAPSAPSAPSPGDRERQPRAAAGTDPGPARGSRPRQTERRSSRGEGNEVDVSLDEQSRVAEEFLHGLVREFGVSADIVSSQPDDDTLDLALTGDDLGMLIGPKGATLLALQDLTRTVVQRKTGASNGRIHVDVSGYRQKRSEALGRFARQVADEVKRTGTRKAMEPMSAPDRKVVHDALTDVDGVSTASEGEDAARRVIILPQDD
jgi:spoIIIJ-associated protein